MAFVNDYPDVNGRAMPKVVVRAMDLPKAFPEHPLFFVLPRGATRNSVNSMIPGIQAKFRLAEEAGDKLTWTAKYGSAAIVSFFGGTTDGMNEHGLSAHLLVLSTSAPEKVDTRPVLPDGLWAQYVLDNFKTVKEVVDAHQGFRVVHSWSPDVGMCRPLGVHLAVQDESGDAAIFEHVDGRLVIHHGTKFRVMTNEPPLDVQLKNWEKHENDPDRERKLPGGVSPEDRFIRLMSFHQRLRKPVDEREAVAGAMSLLRIAQVPFRQAVNPGLWDAVQTNWIAASDVTDKVYYVNSATVPSLFWFDVKQADFSPGQPFLFLDPHDISVGGDARKHLHVWDEHKPAFVPVATPCR